MFLEDLLAKRQTLITEARAIYERAEAAKTVPSAEDVERFDKLMAEAETHDGQIDRFRALDVAVNKHVATRSIPERETATPNDGPVRKRTRQEALGSAEYRNAFETWARRGVGRLGPDQFRAMEAGDTAEGGYWVPTDFERQLVEVARNLTPMRQIATVQNWPNDRQIPITSAHAVAYWTDEEAQYSQSQPTSDQLTINALKATALVKVSEELMADSAFDLGSYLANNQQLGAINTLENTAYTVGNGSTQPQGVVGRAAAGVTAASATAITTDELIDLQESLNPRYWLNGRFMFSQTTRKAVRKLKDANGQYIWQMGVAGGAPETLLGWPVTINPDMATIANGQTTVLAGDFSFFWIVDRGGYFLQRLNELYAEYGYVGFRAFHRSDSNLVLTEAVKKLVQA